MNFKGKDCVIHVPQRLAGMDDCTDNSCKQRAKYLHRSFVIVYTERDQWHKSFMWEKSVCLAEVSVTEHTSRKFTEIIGELSMCKQCVPVFLIFSTHTQEHRNEARDYLVPL